MLLHNVEKYLTISIVIFDNADFSRMKVVFFVHCFFPHHFYGTETYTLELAKNYQAMGINVHIVTALFPGYPVSSRDFISHYTFENLPVTCIDKSLAPNTSVKDTYYQADMNPVLEKILRRLQPDIVHVTHLINHTAALLEVTQALGIHTYATFTDFFGFCFNNKLESATSTLCKGPSADRSNCVACYIKGSGRFQGKRKGLQKLLARGGVFFLAHYARVLSKYFPANFPSTATMIEDLVSRPDILLSLYNSGYQKAVAPTQFLLNAYQQNGCTVPLFNIPFGVDIDRSSKPKRAKQDKIVIGFIGQLTAHKGVDILLSAFNRLPKNIAELHIYGEIKQDPAYMKQLYSQSKGHAIFFKGTFKNSEFAKVLSQMDVCVIPSRWHENSPLVLLNALATHTPVVVSRAAGMLDFVTEDQNGFSFKMGSIEDLTRVLKKILLDREALHHLSSTTHYLNTSRMMAEQTLKIYH
jgi:glycosyltransferase involved in cell wall biosynthesis